MERQRAEGKEGNKEEGRKEDLSVNILRFKRMREK